MKAKWYWNRYASSTQDLEGWLNKHIQPTDYVVIESTTNACMHSVAHHHHLNHPKGKRFNEKNTKWQGDEELSDSEKFQLELDMNTKQHLAEQAEKISKKLARMSHQKPWAESMMYLMQLPGFGVITGMTVLGAIGEITRFENPKHLVSYSGLNSGLEQSGVKVRGKKITKDRRKDLRCLHLAAGTGGRWWK